LQLGKRSKGVNICKVCKTIASEAQGMHLWQKLCMSTNERNVKTQRRYGLNYASNGKACQQDKRMVFLPPRLGLIDVILLLLINNLPSRFMTGKFSRLTISLSDKSIVSNWSCY
jgi:hypothetical protein